jgi:hypothetical protein
VAAQRRTAIGAQRQERFCITDFLERRFDAHQVFAAVVAVLALVAGGIGVSGRGGYLERITSPIEGGSG